MGIMKHNRIRTAKQRRAAGLAKQMTKGRRKHFLRVVHEIVDRAKGAPISTVNAIFIGDKHRSGVIAGEVTRRLLQIELFAMAQATRRNDPCARAHAMNRALARSFLDEQNEAFRNFSESLLPAIAQGLAMKKAYAAIHVQCEESGHLVKPENVEIVEIRPSRIPGHTVDYECTDCLHRTPDDRRYCFAMDRQALWHDPQAIEDMRHRVTAMMNRDIMDAIAGAALTMEDSEG